MEESSGRGICQLGARSDLGCRRNRNEDAIGVFPELGLWVVADGIGGLSDGHLASSLAVETIAEAARSNAALTEAILAAHSAIARVALSRKAMGTTVVAARTRGAEFEIAWAGDARAYSWNGTLSQLTRDHSYVQKMIDAGSLSEGDARVHPKRNVITQMLGVAAHPPRPETRRGSLTAGECLLLCSDGLTRELSDEEISSVLQSPSCAGATHDRLVEQAKQRGGRDNISVILLGCF
jgi:serine/threonine protein phosphatase PrpC